MVRSYGFNRDVGHNMTKEEEYRYRVLVATVSQDHFMSLVRDGRDHNIKHCAWLCLMGLMETYSIQTKDDDIHTVLLLTFGSAQAPKPKVTKTIQYEIISSKF